MKKNINTDFPDPEWTKENVKRVVNKYNTKIAELEKYDAINDLNHYLNSYKKLINIFLYPLLAVKKYYSFDDLRGLDILSKNANDAINDQINHNSEIGLITLKRFIDDMDKLYQENYTNIEACLQNLIDNGTDRNDESFIVIEQARFNLYDNIKQLLKTLLEYKPNDQQDKKIIKLIKKYKPGPYFEQLRQINYLPAMFDDNGKRLDYICRRLKKEEFISITIKNKIKWLGNPDDRDTPGRDLAALARICNELFFSTKYSSPKLKEAFNNYFNCSVSERTYREKDIDIQYRRLKRVFYDIENRKMLNNF